MLKIKIVKFLVRFTTILPGTPPQRRDQSPTSVHGQSLNINFTEERNGMGLGATPLLAAEPIQPVQKSKLTLYWNVSALFSILGFALTVYHIIVQFELLLDRFHPPGNPGMAPTVQTLTTGSRTTIIPSVTSSITFRPGDDSDSENPPFAEAESATITTKISNLLYHALNSVMNIVIRVLVWILLPDIIAISAQLKQILGSSTPGKFTHNEVVALTLLVIGFLLRQFEILVDNILFMKAQKTDIGFLEYAEAVLYHLQFIMSEAFPIECIGVVLVFFITLVACNLKEIVKLFDSNENSEVPFLLSELTGPLEPTYFNVFTIPTIDSNDNAHSGTQTSSFPCERALNHRKAAAPKSNRKAPLPSQAALKKMIKIYTDWRYIWKMAEIVTGAATFAVFLTLTASVSFLIFNSVTAFSSVSAGSSMSPIVLLIDRLQIVFSIGCIANLLCIGTAAQCLNNVIEEIRLKIMLKYWALYTAIENRTHTADDLSNEKYLSKLSQIITQNPIHLSALGFFNVSRSTLTSILGVIVTYLVVLLQFQDASKQSIA